MNFRCAMAFAAGAAVLLLGACGDDDDDDGGGGAASTSIQATASEFKFEPNAWTVPAGQEFSITFRNIGAVEHEWAVINLGADLADESEFAEDKVLFEVEAVPAGESTTQAFTVDEPGTYQVICAIQTHFNAGMEGALTVE
jgi:plastocyanin